MNEPQALRIVDPSGVKCDACGVREPEWMVTKCPGCQKAICEGCEVHNCEDGRHDCPLCGAKLGDCSGLVDDEDDDE